MTDPPVFSQITTNDLDFFEQLLPGFVQLAEEALALCSSDHTEDFCFIPEVILVPENTEEISRILAYCNERQIPVTVRGGGTGLSGGALPLHGGVVLHMKRMNRILDIDVANFQVTVEPGVITQVLQEAVREQGLFYPPDPASRGTCFIGGNIAENSGGPRAVKYGVVKDYVLNLEVVLANGDIIRTGANVLKNATGYNLTQLIVGSEGTLAVITKIVLRLIPAVTHDLLMLAPFKSSIDACRAVNAILLAGHNPSALEFMERDALLFAMKYNPDDAFDLPEEIAAHLLIEVDGNDPDQLFKAAEGIMEVLTQFDTGEILLAESAAQKEQLWKLRRKVGEAVKSHSTYKEEDTVVPRAALPELLKTVKELGVRYGFRSVCYGHAGDGNLHVNILREDMSEDAWKHDLPKAIRELFEKVVALGGTISGEHGIGLVQKEFLGIAIPLPALALMRGIKKIFDPNGILNPGKILPD